MSIIWHNGAFVEDGPVFTAHDRIRLGDGVFNTMLAVGGRVMHGALQFQRLTAHAQVLGIKADLPSDMAGIAEELLRRNTFTNGHYAMNTVISRGGSMAGLRMPDDPKIQIVMRALPLPAHFPPLNAVITGSIRRNEGSPLSRIKSCNYGDNILALREAENAGGNEAILLNNQGFVTCASAGNLFIVRDNALYTPPLADGVMDGLIRRLVIEKCGAQETSLRPEDLRGAQGIYRTNSLRGAVALASLDGKTLPAPSLEIDKDIHLS